MKRMFKQLLAVMVAAPIALSTASAFAATAANTEIKNTATLTYTGGSKSATSIVTVSLIASPPTVVLNPNNAGYLNTNSPELPNSLLLTSTSNGPATYHVTAIVGSSGGQVQVNNGSPATGSVVVTGGAAGFDVTLGASVTTIGSTANTLVIPLPNSSNISGSAGTYMVNGLTYGTTVKFGGFTAKIADYTANPSAIVVNGDGTVTLTLDSAPGAVGAGIPVYEHRTVSGISSRPGTVDVLGTSIHVFSQATVTTTGAGPATSNWADTYWTSAPASTELNKYVRNHSRPSGNPSVTDQRGSCWSNLTNFTVNSSSNPFFDSSCVTGQTGDILEYVVLAKNTSTTTDILNTVISDQIPAAYVNFLFGGEGGNDVYYSADGSGSGNTTFTAAGVSFNQAWFTTWPAVAGATATLNVNVGTGATAGSAGKMNQRTAGPPPGPVTALFIGYKVTIK